MSGLSEDLGTQVRARMAAGRTRAAIVGLGPGAAELAVAVRELGGEATVFDPDDPEGRHPLLRAWEELAPLEPELVVVAKDAEKEQLLRAAADALDAQRPLPDVVLAGTAQQELPDGHFEELEAPALVSSYATGHPHTRRHLYDCLSAAAANGRTGAIVELGAFKGGTSVWLARAVRLLGLEACPVIAFDSWDGFPPRRSLLDLYEHPRCVFRDVEAVRRYTEPYGVELVAGDVFETAPVRLAAEPVLLAFIDTDNYSGTRVALESIRATLVPGGAIVFDHYFTTNDYRYTVGERIAAREVLEGAGLLHLHGTGVFVSVP